VENDINTINIDTSTEYGFTTDTSDISEISDNLQGMGFKVCLVSPELQGRMGEEDIQKAYDFIETNNIVIDGICTKRIDLWERLVD
jgi:hypothetical protein